MTGPGPERQSRIDKSASQSQLINSSLPSELGKAKYVESILSLAGVFEENDVVVLPAQIRLLRTLIGIQLYRLIGLSLLQYAGTLPSAFTIPVVTGDVLTAVLAPVIAVAVSRKRGPPTWAAAIVWNALGMVDLFYALTLAMLTTAGSFILANDQIVVVGAILGITLHIISIRLLLRRQTVSYLLNTA